MSYVRNAAQDVPFVLVSTSTGAGLTGATVTVRRCLDNGTSGLFRRDCLTAQLAESRCNTPSIQRLCLVDPLGGEAGAQRGLEVDAAARHSGCAAARMSGRVRGAICRDIAM